MKNFIVILTLGIFFTGYTVTRSFAEGPVLTVDSHRTGVEQEHGENAGGGEYSDDAYVEDDDYFAEEEFGYMEEPDRIADPLEPVNRVFFHFNDKLYFWVLKPVATGYSRVVPEGARIYVRNFFDNIATPVRFVNCLLQARVEPAGRELFRFGVNSTFGVLGLFDYAKDKLDIPMQEEDFGQTLGVWGSGAGFYINWPVLGPSSLRDTTGLAGDYFLDPVNLVDPTIDRVAVKTGDRVNRVSLSLGDYEEIKKDALDPYSAFKDIYYQYRNNKIEK